MRGALLETRRAVLVVVDIQEAFRSAIPGFDDVARRSAILIQAARLLDVPVIVTEQYPRGLGHTVDELAAHLEGVPRLEKVAFSAARADGFDLHGRDQVLLCGVETHVCVHQTAQDLLSDGIEVQLACDAMDSRAASDKTIAIARMSAGGALASSTEMALFELLGHAGGPAFKTIQGLIK
ncbi:unannotated protein [freshwater metagenome]|uniref:Unannotated protein n=1 Tax=freshwater metagenome TaxID=449393 RepID=A0A6J7HWR8_9ZZZZ|nr:isochorismatase family protein [Actinomycetota bacterium]